MPYVVQGAERFFERAEVRQAMVALRAATRSHAGRDPAGAGGGRGARRGRLGAGPAAARRRRPGALGGAGRAGPLAEEFAAARELRPIGEGRRRCGATADPRRLRRGAGSAGRRSSTCRRSTGSRWRRCTRRRAWSGTRCSWSASPTARCRPRTRRPPSRSRRSGGCSTSGSPGPGSGSGCRTPRPGRRAGGPGGRAGSCRARGWSGGGRAAPAGAGRPTAPSAGAPRSCPAGSAGRPCSAGADRKLGRCATCPSDLDEELFERLREWRRRVAAAQKVPAYVVFTDATLSRWPSAGRAYASELVAIAGIGPRKLGLYGEAVLALVAGAGRRAVRGSRPGENFGN